MAIDGSSRLYVASWAGGQFRYAGENVGYVARLTHENATPTPRDRSGRRDRRAARRAASVQRISC